MKKVLARKKVRNVGLAELKITILVIIETALGVTGLVTYSLADGQLFDAAFRYFTCLGSEEPNCDLGALTTFNFMIPLIFILLSLLPMAVILLSCDLQTCKKLKNPKFLLSRSTQ